MHVYFEEVKKIDYMTKRIVYGLAFVCVVVWHLILAITLPMVIQLWAFMTYGAVLSDTHLVLLYLGSVTWAAVNTVIARQHINEKIEEGE